MRSNLLSLQQTAKLQDVTSNRLATGLKVSSAIDNPSSYYTAQALNSRAEDLGALLDSMGQGVQTIKAATEALEAGAKFLEQAKATASQALEKASGDKPIAVTVSTEAELLDALANVNPADGAIALNRNITMSKNVGLVLKEGQKLVGKTGREKLTFDFDSPTKAIGIELAANTELSGLVIDYTSTDKTNSDDFHAIRNNGHTGVKLSNLNISVKTDDTSHLEMAAIYNASSGEIALDGLIEINAPSTVSQYVYGIKGKGNSSKLIQTDTSTLNISTAGGWGVGIYAGANTLSGTVNISTAGDRGYGINDGTNTLSSTAKLFIETKDITTNAIYISKLSYEIGAKIGLKSAKDAANAGYWQAINANIATAQKTFNSLNGNADFTGLGSFPGIPAVANVLAAYAATPQAAGDEVPDADLVAMANSYNSILGQFNQLINDSGYKGTNLLKEQNLKVNFNEDRSSVVEILGRDASLKGLGLNNGEWVNVTDIETSITELEEAISQIRSMSSEFGNYYSIVTNREEFTQNLINVLTEGADKLTLADMNEESANMLALQTRQQLAVNSLSLASQASQSVLKLF